MINKLVVVSIIILALGLGLYTGYRYEKQKLDKMVGARDMMYTKQLNELQGVNDTLNRAALLGKDHYVMQDGKLMFVTASSVAVKKDVTLDTGSKLTTEGIILKKDGTKQTITNGQSVWMNGTVMNGDGSVMMAK